MSTQLERAALELHLAGVETEVRPSILGAIRAFNSFGHSGGSAEVCKDILRRLMDGENLSPLTDDPDEWRDVTELSNGTPWWQNKRNSKAMSHNGGETYWLIDERQAWRRRWRFVPILRDYYPTHKSVRTGRGVRDRA